MSRTVRTLLTYLAILLTIVYFSYRLVQGSQSRVDWIWLLLPLMLVASLLIFSHPLLGLFLVLMLAPIKTSGDEVLLLAKLLGLFTMLVVFIQKKARRESVQWSGLEAPVLLMALGMGLSFFRTTNVAVVFYSVLSLVSLYSLLLISHNMVEDQKDLQKLALFFMASGIYPIISALLEGAQGPDPERVYTRVSGTFTIPTGLGGFLIPIVIMALALLFYPRFSRILRGMVLAVFGGGVLALVLTLSRGALFGAALGFMIVFIFLAPQLKKNKLTNVVLLAMVYAAAWSAWPSIQGRVIDPVLSFFSGQTSETTITQRTDEMSLVIPMTLDYHFMGTGIGNYAPAAERYRAIYNLPDLPLVPHNILLYFFGMVGILGAVGFIWLLLSLAHTILSSYRMMAAAPQELVFFVYAGAVGSLMGYLPFIITHSGLFSNEMWLSAAFLLISVRLAAETSRVS